MSNVPAFRLYPDEATRLKRENEALCRENNDLLDQIHDLQRQLRAALAERKECTDA